MKVLSLRCAGDHGFEGWFASEDDCRSQLEHGRVECPICTDRRVARVPSAPHLNTSRPREGADPKAAAETTLTSLQSQYLQAVRQLMERTEDVGQRFPEEARRIHYGETPERQIRGQASRAEADALRDEGIEVMALPVPSGLVKGPLQ
jgi:hypothetical protein